jgi:hypothetical protein
LELNTLDLDKDVVLVFMLSEELSLDFPTLFNLYSKHKKMFWKYFYTFFPSIRLTCSKFCSLSKMASNIYSKIKQPFNTISQKEMTYYEALSPLIRNKFECSGGLCDPQGIREYMDFYKDKGFVFKLILNDGSIINRASSGDFDYYINLVEEVHLTSTLETVPESIFKKMSEQEYNRGNLGE